MRHAVSAPPSRDKPRLNKGLGQHLLVSAGVLDDIVTAAEIAPNDLVVEVGPGTGILTARLLAVAESVIAVEIDPEMAAYIQANLENQANLSLIVADIRAQDPARLTASRPYIVVANLPYYAASPTIRLFLESAHAPRRMVVTVQREVATEMTAPPGRAGLLTLATQVYADARVVRRIKPGSFVPAPAVESSVVRLDVLPTPRVEPTLLPSFFRVARAGFSAPRKQLRNSLANGLNAKSDIVADALRRVDIDGRRRAETLTIEEWERLTTAIEQADATSQAAGRPVDP